MLKSCTQCGSPIPAPHRADARFCTSACRQKAYRRRARPLPAELTSRPRWVRHDDSKRPLTVLGPPASVTDPRTWTTYAKASRSSVGVGLGIVLGDGVGCIDLDHCIVRGRLAPWARDIVDAHRADAILIERSRSGEGVHIFLPMEGAPGRRVRDGRNIETYSRDRYIAVTGDRI